MLGMSKQEEWNAFNGQYVAVRSGKCWSDLTNFPATRRCIVTRPVRALALFLRSLTKLPVITWGEFIVSPSPESALFFSPKRHGRPQDN